MYKLTFVGKTMVGCNEDAWRTTSHIWFENAKNTNEYGAGFTGSRQVGPNTFAPQSGMNEAGLTFSRLVSYFPKQNEAQIGKKTISNEVSFLTSILHQCSSIEEVKQVYEQYDHSLFIDDVFIYIDATGKYLVVEPYALIEGNDPYYVLSNFCPSITEPAKARKLDRYRIGEDLLRTHPLDSSLAFCSALSDTMHVCRKRNGDGTLLTSIWDSKNGQVSLYFYHNFETVVQFNLKEELAKGDQLIEMASLFPINAEFERLATYTTPFNKPQLRVLLFLVSMVLSLFSMLYIIHYFRRRKTEAGQVVLLVLCGLNLLLSGYFFVLDTNINIFYFDAPYQHYSSALVSLSSYMPFLMLLAILPLLLYSLRYLKAMDKNFWMKSILVFNNVIYLFSILGFAYWGLFDVFQ